jgi:hypothetical protein
MINGVERHRTTLFSADDRRNISRRRWSASTACCAALHRLPDLPRKNAPARRLSSIVGNCGCAVQGIGLQNDCNHDANSIVLSFTNDKESNHDLKATHAITHTEATDPRMA